MTSYSFQIGHNFINGSTEFVLPCDDLGNVGVKFFNIYFFGGVFLFHIAV